MQARLKAELGTTLLKSAGRSEGGYICECKTYDTDTGRVFVKIHRNSEAKLMFDGEMTSLESILKTSTVKVPKPVKVIELDRGSALVMEHLDMKELSKHSKCLGEQLADMHLYNKRQLQQLNKDQQTVGRGVEQLGSDAVVKFGFDVPTCCGLLPQTNDWQDDWVTFFTRQRLEHQLDLIEKSYGDKELRELWAELQLKIPQFFKGVKIVPALVHGDLWRGNVAECEEGPVIFDPSSLYAHSEFELGLAVMFGDFEDSFYSAYHEKIPKAPGFDQRNQLYQLFTSLNHWNHFGLDDEEDYRGSSIRIMKDLIK